MSTQVVVIVLVVIVVLILAVMVWMSSQRRRSEELRERFGPEYQRTVEQTWDRRRAETVLEQRARRVEGLDIRPLSSADQARFGEAWHAVQARFVDDPPGAVAEADRLVGEVMQARGYPVADFEQRAADISVDHPHVVENYRTAHAVAERSAGGQASTEDLRQATVSYRALFQELLEAPRDQQMGASR